jgi:predicted small lipoprotein YifL
MVSFMCKKTNRWPPRSLQPTLRAIGFCLAMATVGCGQKGPLVMPTPQYPAPAAPAAPSSSTP